MDQVFIQPRAPLLRPLQPPQLAVCPGRVLRCANMFCRLLKVIERALPAPATIFKFPPFVVNRLGARRLEACLVSNR